MLSSASKWNGIYFWEEEYYDYDRGLWLKVPGSKVHGAYMGPTWLLSTPDVPYVGPMDLDGSNYIWVINNFIAY